MPLPYLTRARMLQVLAPQPGERILEVGPGIGYHALTVAEALQPGGVLDALDLQQEMLDDLSRRAARRAITNIQVRQGDARRLPYQDGNFDAAYLITVLGEIGDVDATLAELRRVLRPGGRLVVGEFLINPRLVQLRRLTAAAERFGFRFQTRVGPPLSWLATFIADDVDPAPRAPAAEEPRANG